MKSPVIARYFWRRHKWGLGIYMVGLLVFILIMLFVMVPYTQERVMEFSENGGIDVRTTNAGMAVYVNPAVIVGTGAYSYIVFLLALMIIGRERRYFVSLSTTRYEILLGSFLYLVSLSAVLALAGGLIIPVIVRTGLWIAGFSTRGGWTVSAVLTGGDPQWLRALVLNFLDMVEVAGIATFAGYLLQRWWKPMLILCGAGIVAIILIATQLSSAKYVQMLVSYVIEFLQYVESELYPAMMRYFAETNLALITLRKIGVCVGLTALSYPVMRSMKVA